MTGFSAIYRQPGTDDYLTVKLNANGQGQWAQRYNGPGDQYGTKFDGARALIVDGAGNVYVAGSIFSGPKLSQSL